MLLDKPLARHVANSDNVESNCKPNTFPDKHIQYCEAIADHGYTGPRPLQVSGLGLDSKDTQVAHRLVLHAVLNKHMLSLSRDPFFRAICQGRRPYEILSGWLMDKSQMYINIFVSAY